MRKRLLLFVCLLVGGTDATWADTPALSFWNQYDARKDPLQLEVVKAWEDAIGQYQLVRYRLGKQAGSNKTASPIMAAYYGYPKGATKVPGIVHIHGGGQRAHKGRVADWVKLGYACISINWGGRVLEEPDTPNTDWDGLAVGFLRPGVTKADELDHHNLVRPDTNTLHREPHLLNSSWNLIALSARRALTVLEQQPEVDGSRLGVEGHSMGGRSTVLTAIDPRVKAASPSVGGSGYLYEDLWGLPGSARRMRPEDGLELYRHVVSAQAYWRHIKAPTLFLGASNDFNSPTECVIKGMAQLPEPTERMLVLAPHLNHRFTTSTAAARFMWMEAHLKENFTFPKASASALILDTPDKIPVFQVTVDTSSGLPVERVEIYYGYARDPRIRFWRSATVERRGEVSVAACPVFDVAEPLFAFANITYKMPRTLPARPGHPATDLLTVSSMYQTAYPDALKAAGVKATEIPQRTLDDFSGGWRDWYRLNADNPVHWFYATRKIIDPSWMGPRNGTLAMDLETTMPGNHLAVGVEVNAWQFYTGRQSDSFHAFVELEPAGQSTIALRAGDFKNAAGLPLADWDEATELTFTPARRVKGAPATKPDWQGAPLALNKLRWEGGIQIKRPHPHQARGARSGGGTPFEDAFQQAIDDSVKLEQLDEPVAQGGRVYLSKELASSVKSFWRVMNDASVSGKPIRVGGTQYKRGLGVHAESEITFPLGGTFASFHVVPGPDDAHHGRLEMNIYVDGKNVFASGPTSSRDGTSRRPLKIPLVGAKTLTLRVDSAGGDRGGDHASWADAYLVKAAAPDSRGEP